MAVATTADGIRAGTLFFPYKYIALTLVLLHSTTIVLVMRYSRTAVAEDGKRYLSTSAVAMGEVFKVIASFFLLAYERQRGLADVVQHLKVELVDNFSGAAKLGVPAGLYTVQNNLLFIALSNLDAATYQVTYQLKILTTAIFSVLMLGKVLDRNKWLSLVMLMAGVALVQLAQQQPSGKKSEAAEHGTALVGLVAVLLACCSSGFAGVYFEKILKGTRQSVWLRNFQLGLFSIGLALAGVYINDGEAVAKDGFFQGYNRLTWVVITLQALGGLVIAAVIKYADNILKSFATSLSIILTAFISWVFLGDFPVSLQFLFGTSLVIGATFLYGMSGSPPPARPTESTGLPVLHSANQR